MIETQPKKIADTNPATEIYRKVVADSNKNAGKVPKTVAIVDVPGISKADVKLLEREGLLESRSVPDIGGGSDSYQFLNVPGLYKLALSGGSIDMDQVPITGLPKPGQKAVKRILAVPAAGIPSRTTPATVIPNDRAEAVYRKVVARFNKNGSKIDKSVAIDEVPGVSKTDIKLLEREGLLQSRSVPDYGGGSDSYQFLNVTGLYELAAGKRKSIDDMSIHELPAPGRAMHGASRAR